MEQCASLKDPEVSAPLVYPFDVVEEDKPWWRCSEAEALARATQAGSLPSYGELNASCGTPWDGSSSITVDGVDIAAWKLSNLVRLISNDIRKNNLSVRRLPDFRDVRSLKFYDNVHDETVDVIAIVFHFWGFSVPIAVEAPWLAVKADHLLNSVAHDFGLWLRDAHEHRADLCREASVLHQQIDEFTCTVGSGFMPLRLAMQPKLCFVYDGWPDHAKFELLSCVLGPQLEWRLDQDEIERNQAPPLGPPFAARLRWRTKMLSVLQETGAPCLITDVAMAIAVDRQIELAPLIKAVREREAWGGSVTLQAEGEWPLVDFFMQERTLHVRVTTDQVTYSTGRLRLDGHYPTIMTLGATDRHLSDLIDYQPFKATAARITQANDLSYALELHHDTWVLPATYLAVEGAEQQLNLLRDGKSRGRAASPDPSTIGNWHFMP